MRPRPTLAALAFSLASFAPGNSATEPTKEAAADLSPQLAFLEAAGEYSEKRPFTFLKLFGPFEIARLRSQLLARQAPCAQQLALTGLCDLSGLSVEADTVRVRIDQSCLQVTRTGKRSGEVKFALPQATMPPLPKPKDAIINTLKC